MATVKKTVKKSANKTYSLRTKISTKKEVESAPDLSLIQKLESQLNINQSYVSLLLGLLIVFVVGVLVFNYLKKHQATSVSTQQSSSIDDQAAQTTKDAQSGNLPGKYTVKDGDTLFVIAKNYYKDGYKYPLLVSANKIANENIITPGQVLDIPKQDAPQVAASDVSNKSTQAATLGTGGAVNETIWGDKITGNTYTVQAGDWLSKIAGRAYGDIYSFDKIAKANNIADPNNLEPGTVLNIPH